MNFLFCSSSLSPSKPCPTWEEEVQAASTNHNIFYLNEEHVQNNDFILAVQHLPILKSQEQIIYRGWVRSAEQYSSLYFALLNRGYKLINTPEQYLGGLYLPNWYSHIHEYTPLTLIVEKDIDRDDLHNKLKIFNGSPLIIKDYVSSRKQDWHDACFIYSSSDIDEIDRVVNNFIQIQENYSSFVGGLVFRRFVNLHKIGTHPKSNMPISQEYRSFVYNGNIIGTYPYWDMGNYEVDFPPTQWIEKLAKLVYNNVGSNFFTIDTALQENNEGWICIEMGDGQVSGLSDRINKHEFYNSFK